MAPVSVRKTDEGYNLLPVQELPKGWLLINYPERIFAPPLVVQLHENECCLVCMCVCVGEGGGGVKLPCSGMSVLY